MWKVSVMRQEETGEKKNGQKRERRPWLVCGLQGVKLLLLGIAIAAPQWMDGGGWH